MSVQTRIVNAASNAWRSTLLTTIWASSVTLTTARQHLPGPVWSAIDVWMLCLVDLVRLCPGRKRADGIDKCHRPKEPLILYEYEGCPFCRKVRETLSTLDIDHLVYPCPKESLSSTGTVNSRYRNAVMEKGSKLLFPFLVDPNTKQHMYESDDIINYLWSTYGANSTRPLAYKLAHSDWFKRMSLNMSMLMRTCLDMGMLRAPSRMPEKPIEIWGYESSPFVRRVREVLSMLELPHLMHVVPFGSLEKRAAFASEHKAHLQSYFRSKLNLCKFPFMRDPNTGVELFESAEIVSYLKKKYQTGDIPKESWWNYGKSTQKKAEKQS